MKGVVKYGVMRANSSGEIVICLQVGPTVNNSLIHCGGSDLLRPKRPDRLWDPFGLLSGGQLKFFARG